MSSGEFNTWGLNTVTGTLAWTRNADLNQFSRDNWNTATNNPVANGVAQGTMVDFDAGYDALIGVTDTSISTCRRIHVESSRRRLGRLGFRR